MRETRQLLLLLLPAVVLTLSAFVVPRQDDQTAAIREALQYYLDGHATGDPEIMAQAFHPSARLQFIRDGAVGIRPLEEYLHGMSGRPAADESERNRRIVSIEYVGTVATAKIELDYPGVFFTDYMQLLKTAEGWKIVNKIYDMERK
ncbi:MAG: nuclear transport factor 2 family protein [Gemmatimonadales bacterium]|jgi:hypothetical protein